MATKTYTVRVPAGAPDIASEPVAQWLDSYVGSPVDLALDPGAGERSLRLSLDKQKVEQGAQIAGEADATFLRRLIATNMALPSAQPQAAKDEPRPKSPVLKGTLKLHPDQVRPLVQVFESGQSFLIRRAFRVPQAVKAAAFTDQERQELSALASEALNRRAPRVVVENGDLFALATKLLAVECRTIEQVKREAEQVRKQDALQKGAPQPSGRQPAVTPAPATCENDVVSGNPAVRSSEGESLEGLPYPADYLGREGQ